MKRERLRDRLRLSRLGFAPQAVLLLLVLVLVGAMAIQPTRQLLAQHQRVAGVASDLARLQRSNERLKERIAKLRDPTYIEQLARGQIGLVQPGEIPYAVLPPANGGGKHAGRHGTRPRGHRAQPAPGFVQRVLNFIGIG
jgi:cell division protein FtsB